MFDVKYKINENRIYAKLEGLIRVEEAKKFRTEMESVQKKMKRGGTYIIDATQLKTLPQDSSAEIQKAREHAVKHGVGKGVVILNDSILAMQTKRMSKKVEGFDEAYVESMKEAIAVLD